jgi:hypothetical protein
MQGAEIPGFDGFSEALEKRLPEAGELGDRRSRKVVPIKGVDLRAAYLFSEYKAVIYQAI